MRRRRLLRDGSCRGDAYLLSLILHDWNDAECVQILSSIRRAIPSNGVLLILENVIPDGTERHLDKVIDTIMMTILDGTERTRPEYAATAAGFSLDAVVATQAPTSLIVARPSDARARIPDFRVNLE